MNLTFVEKAKVVATFVAFCIEFKNCMQAGDPLTFVSNLPILVDCTCNGLQHLAALMRDVQTARATNLTPEPVVSDIYTEVINKLQTQLKQIVTSYSDGTAALKLERSMVKKIIMTIPYNVTEHSAYKYLTEHFTYNAKTKLFSLNEQPSIKLTHKNLYDISSLIYKSFFRLHPKLHLLVMYFKNIASLMSKLNLPIRWVTPKGLCIVQQYVKFKEKRIKSVFGLRNITLRIPTDAI